ncbi:protein FLX-like 3 [Amaranthus tricolor]|uniref:protein FLX-like 3 n=1 Tax=Amaranthus tricolor TaxID=29722 RepID=UPI0025859DDE|nr:protein FLX-like 3 [Amaranthus tricolor]XP_057549825.1 protein FLX-like 3 [Amaranthus tricolor]XP_057549826.1 protein FLX-like 3 [Amaranthus tricolor]XP_057549827.1 protein FLX-like 3 [Amaranthus tricolor]XP_057549828.1 protein FLX-like 3 [Amaranthus tricolor]XP_057549829.1 protein FLX-like 3 [Amaranthus tricolor]XP_057549831.1 protein FLX-like 3 [Amaranthus tricolor]XP_057549832.1 protein FLX-like 3 [Amaranthus tricolor]
MAGRNRVPRAAFNDRHGHLPGGNIVRGPLSRSPLPHPAILEEEIEIQRVEIRKLFDDNRTLAEDRVALQREVNAAREDIHRLNLVISDIRREHDAHSRELIDQNLKLEAGVREAESFKKDAKRLRSEVQGLEKIRLELGAQVAAFTKDLSKLQAENKQIPHLKAQIESMQQELMHARAAIDYENKAKMALMEQKQAMENNVISMAREVEKLRAELTSSNARPWPTGAPYGMKLNSPEAGYPGHYGDRYDPHMGAAEKAPLYGLGSSAWGGVEKRACR